MQSIPRKPIDEGWKSNDDVDGFSKVHYCRGLHTPLDYMCTLENPLIYYEIVDGEARARVE